MKNIKIAMNTYATLIPCTAKDLTPFLDMTACELV
jgi:hypothetical protein